MSSILYDTDYNQWVEQTAKQLREGNHWASEIVNFRYQIHKRLKESPSLKPKLESIYAEGFPIALKSVSKLFLLPSDAHISLEQALDDDWFSDQKY